MPRNAVPKVHQRRNDVFLPWRNGKITKKIGIVNLSYVTLTYGQTAVNLLRGITSSQKCKIRHLCNHGWAICLRVCQNKQRDSCCPPLCHNISASLWSGRNVSCSRHDRQSSCTCEDRLLPSHCTAGHRVLMWSGERRSWYFLQALMPIKG